MIGAKAADLIAQDHGLVRRRAAGRRDGGRRSGGNGEEEEGGKGPLGLGFKMAHARL